MEKVKLLVACHKPAKVFQNDVYTPIQVGKALHSDLNLGFITDDTGDNISKLNPLYCELTAQYWGWKNLDCEYIGLQHYRRYFDFVFDEKNVDKVFKDCDVVLPDPFYLPASIFDFWCENLVPEDVYVAVKLLESMYPEDYGKGQRFLCGNKHYPCNMFLCKKTLFDEFAAWQFPYLGELRKYLRMSGYSRERRILGFLAEGLLPMYFINRGCRIKTMPIVSYPNTKEYQWINSRGAKLKQIFIELKRKQQKNPLINLSDTLLGGLKQDGILDDQYHIILNSSKD